MSRSYHHSKHRIFLLESEIKSKKDTTLKKLHPHISRNGNIEFYWKFYKHKPYGMKLYTGYGGETYYPAIGEIIEPVINKSRERRKNKININNIEE